MLHDEDPGIPSFVQVGVVRSESMLEPRHVAESPHFVVVEPRPEELRESNVFPASRSVAALVGALEEEIDVAQVAPCPVTVF